jgi:hypothetical protein
MTEHFRLGASSLPGVDFLRAQTNTVLMPSSVMRCTVAQRWPEPS